jgi:hypothetical protein
MHNPPSQPPLRRPTDKLADCVWLPRLVDKARLYLRGALAEAFVQPFCHPLATDGLFLKHFALDKESLLAAVTAAADDVALAAWFTSQPQVTAHSIALWNELAPNLGKDGYPMRRAFLWALKRYAADRPIDPRVDCIFAAIALDEGYLD